MDRSKSFTDRDSRSKPSGPILQRTSTMIRRPSRSSSYESFNKSKRRRQDSLDNHNREKENRNKQGLIDAAHEKSYYDPQAYASVKQEDPTQQSNMVPYILTSKNY